MKRHAPDQPTSTPHPKPRLNEPLAPWVRQQLRDLSNNPFIFGTQKTARGYGLKAARWFYNHNFSRPHPTTSHQRYYCHANMWFIADQLRIPVRSLQRKVRALEAYGFLRRLTVASKTGRYDINTWQVAHTPIVRGQFYAKVLRGDLLLPPIESPPPKTFRPPRE